MNRRTKRKRERERKPLNEQIKQINRQTEAKSKTRKRGTTPIHIQIHTTTLPPLKPFCWTFYFDHSLFFPRPPYPPSSFYRSEPS